MRHLGLHKKDHKYWLKMMAESKYSSFDSDCYNTGPLVDLLESRVAELLGKPRAMIFNKGTICQLAALKTICESKQNSLICIHPQSHIAIDEKEAYSTVTGLQAVQAGQWDQTLNANDLKDLGSIPAVVVVEMPLRRAGFRLQDWEGLLRIKEWCDKHAVHLHMDGARIWESLPFYEKSASELCSIFDSIYVSLYKGLGGVSGALLIGDEDFLTDCQIWRERLGSQSWTQFPSLITGLEGLDHKLPLIPCWVERAKEIAAALNTLNGVQLGPVQTNGFQLSVFADLKNTNKRYEELKATMNMNPARPFAAAKEEGWIFTEIQVWAEHTEIKTREVLEFFQRLLCE